MLRSDVKHPAKAGESAMDLRLTEEQLEFKKAARDFLEA